MNMSGTFSGEKPTEGRARIIIEKDLWAARSIKLQIKLPNLSKNKLNLNQ